MKWRDFKRAVLINMPIAIVLDMLSSSALWLRFSMALITFIFASFLVCALDEKDK